MTARPAGPAPTTTAAHLCGLLILADQVQKDSKNKKGNSGEILSEWESEISTNLWLISGEKTRISMKKGRVFQDNGHRCFADSLSRQDT
jgi:hypothetical protein